MPIAKGQALVGAGSGQGYAARKIRDNIGEMASQYGYKALSTLVEIMTDRDQPGATRNKSAEIILGYAYGKAVDRIAVASMNGGTSEAPQTLTTAQLIAALSSTLEHRAEEQVLEHNQVEDSQAVETPPAGT